VARHIAGVKIKPRRVKPGPEPVLRLAIYLRALVADERSTVSFTEIARRRNWDRRALTRRLDGDRLVVTREEMEALIRDSCADRPDSDEAIAAHLQRCRDLHSEAMAHKGDQNKVKPQDVYIGFARAVQIAADPDWIEEPLLTINDGSDAQAPDRSSTANPVHDGDDPERSDRRVELGRPAIPLPRTPVRWVEDPAGSEHPPNVPDLSACPVLIARPGNTPKRWPADASSPKKVLPVGKLPREPKCGGSRRCLGAVSATLGILLISVTTFLSSNFHKGVSALSGCSRGQVAAQDLWLRDEYGAPLSQLVHGQRVTFTSKPNPAGLPYQFARADDGRTGWVDARWVRPTC
jgi:hypothetical protein